MFETEMRRSIAVSESDEAYDKTCFEGLDEDVLLHPWMAFDSLCWGSAIERLRASQQAGGWDTVPCAPVFSKPLPDVPVDPIGSKLLGSRQVILSCILTHLVLTSSLHDPSRAFPGTAAHPHIELDFRVASTCAKCSLGPSTFVSPFHD
ncbi:hypothetical protein SCP_0305770 [Sparassis crispa]|uniref:Uncharacterized protein n=1 Tax=Sparassis crispa TaxID=139825 RepID=A0A401GF96_9APHY|nr:hypothetical protein SCP_0305770 [Sparassis crispa]GBE80857.1 hypothetical protein SCP_0305770 [Sparassis crispa]